MRGAPWDGMFYGFVLLVLVFVGALTEALHTPDFLFRTIAWALVLFCLVRMVRIVRRAVRTEPPERTTGRWWFGG